MTALDSATDQLRKAFQSVRADEEARLRRLAADIHASEERLKECETAEQGARTTLDAVKAKLATATKSLTDAEGQAQRILNNAQSEAQSIIAKAHVRAGEIADQAEESALAAANAIRSAMQKRI